jgi:dUTP pyrophosphatase
MKTIIKVKLLNNSYPLEIYPNGDWIDLRAADSITLKGTKKEPYNIPLGVAIKLPKGFEAIVAPRSSTPKKVKLVCANSIGIIDNSYCGNDDQWMFPSIPLGNTTIAKGTRICQFRIQLSQKATMWQKIKWLFSNGIKITTVSNLESTNRGGFGEGTKLWN